MAVIEYKIEVPQKAMDLLVNVYSPTKQECAVMKVTDFETEKRDNPFYWSFTKFWHEHAKTISDKDIRRDLVKEYWDSRKKVARHKIKGRVYRKNPLFFHAATSIKELAELSEESVENVKTYMRDYLFGLAGVVIASFHHAIHTGNSEEDTEFVGFLPHGVPVKGKPIIVVRYDSVYVPFPITDNVQKSIDDGADERGFFEIPMQVNKSSLPVLEYIIRRTRELEEKKLGEKGKLRRTYVEFHDSELARVNGMSKARTKEAVRDLLGVVVEAVHPINMRRYSNTVFLPSCRRELAEALERFA